MSLKRLCALSLVVFVSAVSAQGAMVTVRTAPGRQVRGPMYAVPPEGMPPLEEVAESLQPPVPVEDTGIYIPAWQGVETEIQLFAVPSASASAIVVLRDSELSPPSGFRRTVSSPSLGSQGSGLFITHNWYAAISTDNGGTFSYVSPFSLSLFPKTPPAFSAGFCCNQRVAQDPSRDLIFWYLQYYKNGNTASSTNGVRIAVAHGATGLAHNTWISYDITPTLLGLGSGRWLDSPHLEVGASYLYFTANVRKTTDDTFYGAVVARIPLAQLDAGSSLSIDTFFTTSYGDIMAVDGAEPAGTRPGRYIMYFAALKTSTSVVVLRWPEVPGPPIESEVTGLATTSLSTPTCTGPDSLDPCTRAWPRMQAGWITGSELGLMWTSSQNGGDRPYPYTRVAILNPSTLTVLAQPDLWDSQHALLYPAVAVNERGHLGGTIDALGGTLYPTILVFLRDDLSLAATTNGWQTCEVVESDNGAGAWGDWNGAATHELHPATWLGAGHIQSGGTANANARVHTFWFMRQRDVPVTLTVSKINDGTGTVTSAPAGINCGGDCSEDYSFGTEVTLIATEDPGSEFTGWLGDCSGKVTCVVNMTQGRSVQAGFQRTSYNLVVTLPAGNGSGSVSSDPAGIACGAGCSTYDAGTQVTLTATAAEGSVFTGWSGDCSGTGGCDLLMTEDRSVTATFELLTFELTVSKSGGGAGTVTSDPTGIDCGSDCSETYNYGTLVMLTATPATGSVFDGWSGACTGTGTCNVTMDQAKSVTATFSVATFDLTLSKSGDGKGTVTSSPTGINCGFECTADGATYVYATVVTLNAESSPFSVFQGWSGGGCTGTGPCIVTMDQARSVTAAFDDPGVDFYTVTPCRVLDTRTTASPLVSGVTQILTITGGDCGIPSTAKAVSLNLTAIQAPNSGSITLFPGDLSLPGTSTISFKSLKDRANNAIMPLATNGDGTLGARATLTGGGNVNIAVDVNGYFE